VFFVAGWAIAQIVGAGIVVTWIAWFVGLALLHDLVLVPLYSVLDRLGRLPRARGPVRPPAINYLRVPAVISGILLLVYFPLILGLASANYRNDTGHSLSGYTRNWLLVTAALFVGSALLYSALSIRRRQRSPRPVREHPRG
jgi:hypothetical protein